MTPLHLLRFQPVCERSASFKQIYGGRLLTALFKKIYLRVVIVGYVCINLCLCVVSRT